MKYFLSSLILISVFAICTSRLLRSSSAFMMSNPSSTTPSSKNILVAGGAGYIATHTIFCLLEAGYDITIVDNLVNSEEEGIRRVKQLTGCDPSRVRFFNVNICDNEALEKVFESSPVFESCIHFAGLKAVGESVRLPLLYYENNVGGTLCLLKLLEKYKCHSIVFSSSATVR